jgi:hypothetical protein
MIGFNHLGRMGRLGNQMFQFAATKGIAKNMGYEFVVANHTEPFDDGIGNMVRTEIFDSFDIECETGLIETTNYTSEKHYHFDEHLFSKCPDNISLYGFFQTEKYFKHIEDDIRKDFTFKDDILEPCKDMIGGESYNSLHIRRTDYIKNSISHTNLTPQYYESALRGFDSNSKFIIFSDDPEWCKKQKMFEGDRFLISESADNRIDLCLMSLCKGHIIANSSFSWWGAWLAKSQNVVAPKHWFGPKLKHQNTKDLYCSGWVVL